jgi:hypothetical protein
MPAREWLHRIGKLLTDYSNPVLALALASLKSCQSGIGHKATHLLLFPMIG